MESMVPRPPLSRRLPPLDPVTRRQSLLVAALHLRESVTKLLERFLLVQPKGKYDKRYLESLHFSHSTILATEQIGNELQPVPVVYICSFIVYLYYGICHNLLNGITIGKCSSRLRLSIFAIWISNPTFPPFSIIYK